jgi:hypothetical protein
LPRLILNFIDICIELEFFLHFGIIFDGQLFQLFGQLILLVLEHDELLFNLRFLLANLENFVLKGLFFIVMDFDHTVHSSIELSFFPFNFIFLLVQPLLKSFDGSFLSVILVLERRN